MLNKLKKRFLNWLTDEPAEEPQLSPVEQRDADEQAAYEKALATLCAELSRA